MHWPYHIVLTLQWPTVIMLVSRFITIHALYLQGLYISIAIELISNRLHDIICNLIVSYKDSLFYETWDRIKDFILSAVLSRRSLSFKSYFLRSLSLSIYMLSAHFTNILNMPLGQREPLIMYIGYCKCVPETS